MRSRNGPGSRSGLDIPAVVRQLRKGVAYPRLARRLGCSITLLHNIARAHGLPPRQRRITREQIDAILAAARTGEPFHRIAKRVGVSYTSAQRIASKVGLRRYKVRKLPAYAMAQDHANGATCAEIAAKLGVPRSAVLTLLQRLGVDTGRWGRKATDQQLRACFQRGLNANQAALELGIKPSGGWYARWRRVTAARAVSA